MAASEAFPILSTSPHKFASLPKPTSNDSPRLRRRSSGLGGEIRAGDTGVPALATLDVRPPSPGTLKEQADRDRKKPFSKRRKARTLFQQWKRYALKHTWVSPLVLLGIFFALFAVNPTKSNPIYYFIFLAYRIEPTPDAVPGDFVQYGKGLWDFAFLTFYTIVLSFTREFIMQKVLRPLARRSGLKSRAKQSRFMEQMYTAIYFAFTGPWGLYVMSRTPVWYFNTRGMYENSPHHTHDAHFKFYYLFQAAYWLQQAIVLVLGLEEPRKDYNELVAHHVVTLSLIAMSYRFHFTYMGLAVFITHDISDFFLATSKTLNYLDHPLVVPYFIVFVFAWVYMRHYLNLVILWSEFNEFKTVGPYVLDWEAEQFKSPLAHYISTVLLASLQGLNLFWLFHILRIAYRITFLDVVEDDRSDNDDDAFEAEQKREEADRKRRAARSRSSSALEPVGEEMEGGVKVLLNGEDIGNVAVVNGNGSAKTTVTGLENREGVRRTSSRRKP